MNEDQRRESIARYRAENARLLAALRQARHDLQKLDAEHAWKGIEAIDAAVAGNWAAWRKITGSES